MDNLNNFMSKFLHNSEVNFTFGAAWGTRYLKVFLEFQFLDKLVRHSTLIIIEGGLEWPVSE